MDADGCRRSSGNRAIHEAGFAMITSDRTANAPS
jgi:hypothetical protein